MVVWPARMDWARERVEGDVRSVAFALVGLEAFMELLRATGSNGSSMEIKLRKRGSKDQLLRLLAGPKSRRRILTNSSLLLLLLLHRHCDEHMG